MKKIIFLIISVIVGIMVYNQNEDVVIPMDAIRVRIVANSNNIEDLYEKKKLKEEIKSELYDLVKDVNSSSEASNNIEKNMEKINKLVSSKISDYSINYGMNYFPSKTYKGVIYKEGNYHSLVITLGKGLGENWWCVLYPPLCMMEDNPSTSNVEYRSFIKDWLNN